MIKISVVTAVYNRANTVGHAITSVLSQSHPAVESIVIDGGSTDGTLAVIEHYRSRLAVFISEHDQGVYHALNKGIMRATGDVVGFLHGDDVFENSDVLAKVAAAFADSKVDAVYGDLVYVRNDDITRVVRYWQAGMYTGDSASKGWMPPHPTFYVRRSVYERFGGFDTRYRIAADYDLMLRFLVVAKVRLTYIPEVLVRMRAGGISNRSLTSILRKSMEDFKVLRRNGIGGAWTLLRKNISKVSQFWRRSATIS